MRNHLFLPEYILVVVEAAKTGFLHFFVVVVFVFFVLQFYFIFKLYIFVLVLPNIKMNPPQVYISTF